jgi:hypothetical protein
MTTIWTVGHSTRTAAEFLDLLKRRRIELVADVRHFPGSPRFPQFDLARLRETLAAAGIGYVHLPQLGGRRPVRPGSRNLSWRNASFRGYADHMETEDYKAGIDRLLGLARSRRTAIMCAEAVWWRCHRSLISDHLKSIGLRVLHILGPDRVEEHPYTPAARLIEGRLTYEPPPTFKVGDHVKWNSEAGLVRGTVRKKITAPIEFKGYTVRASKEEPQYLIKSDKTDHLAMHKGSALQKIPRARKAKPSPLT